LLFRRTRRRQEIYTKSERADRKGRREVNPEKERNRELERPVTKTRGYFFTYPVSSTKT
jgi:hypothetical protein